MWVNFHKCYAITANSALLVCFLIVVIICHHFTLVSGEQDSNSRYIISSVDYLLNPRHTQCDVHGGDTREMERFECHLCGGLPHALCP